MLPGPAPPYSALESLVDAAARAAQHPHDAPLPAGLALGTQAGADADGTKAKRKPKVSLQLDLDEDDVLQELEARGLVKPPPGDGARPQSRGGRPPLGMGPYRRVRELYDKRAITMEGWRQYYADKCRELGYGGAFRKDLRPRIMPVKSGAKRPRAGDAADTAAAALAGLPPSAATAAAVEVDTPAAAAALATQAEARLVKALCRDLVYPAETPAVERFEWDKAASDEANIAALREYLAVRRPLRARRGKRPDGIAWFPLICDMWTLALVESGHFRRTARYAGLDLLQLQAMLPAAPSPVGGGGGAGAPGAGAVAVSSVHTLGVPASHRHPMPGVPVNGQHYVGSAPPPPPLPVLTHGEGRREGVASAGVPSLAIPLPGAAVPPPPGAAVPPPPGGDGLSGSGLLGDGVGQAHGALDVAAPRVGEATEDACMSVGGADEQSALQSAQEAGSVPGRAAGRIRLEEGELDADVRTMPAGSAAGDGMDDHFRRDEPMVQLGSDGLASSQAEDGVGGRGRGRGTGDDQHQGSDVEEHHDAALMPLNHVSAMSDGGI